MGSRTELKWGRHPRRVILGACSVPGSSLPAPAWTGGPAVRLLNACHSDIRKARRVKHKRCPGCCERKPRDDSNRGQLRAYLPLVRAAKDHYFSALIVFAVLPSSPIQDRLAPPGTGVLGGSSSGPRRGICRKWCQAELCPRGAGFPAGPQNITGPLYCYWSYSCCLFCKDCLRGWVQETRREHWKANSSARLRLMPRLLGRHPIQSWVHPKDGVFLH